MVLRGHEGSVNFVSVSSDKRSILSGGKDGSIKFWDVNGSPDIKPSPGAEKTLLAYACQRLKGHSKVRNSTNVLEKKVKSVCQSLSIFVDGD